MLIMKNNKFSQHIHKGIVNVGKCTEKKKKKTGLVMPCKAMAHSPQVVSENSVECSRAFLRALACRFTFNDFLLVAAYLVVIHILWGVERSALFKKESGTGRPRPPLALDKMRF